MNARVDLWTRRFQRSRQIIKSFLDKSILLERLVEQHRNENKMAVIH